MTNRDGGAAFRQTHDLKCSTEYFDAVASAAKNFEVRRDDRGFQRGDTLVLRRYGMCATIGKMRYLNGDYSVYQTDADTIKADITYVLTGGQFGIEPGYVVLGIAARQEGESHDQS